MLRKTIVASVGVAVLAFAGGAPVSADRGGSPNVEACTGQVIAALARDGVNPGLKYTFSDLIVSSYGRRAQELCATGLYSPEQVVQKVREAGSAP